MADIKNANLIIVKGLLFLLLGVMASAILVCLTGRFDVLVLLLISIWAFCRFYYFAFYVIQNYVDSQYKFDGLYSAALYLLRRGKSSSQDDRDA